MILTSVAHYNMMIFSSEVRVAEQRAVAFAERLWTDRFLNRDLELRNLMNTRIISGLTRWLFNSLSRHLMSFEMADRKGALLYSTVLCCRESESAIPRHTTPHHTTPHHTTPYHTIPHHALHNYFKFYQFDPIPYIRTISFNTTHSSPFYIPYKSLSIP